MSIYFRNWSGHKSSVTLICLHYRTLSVYLSSCVFSGIACERRVIFGEKNHSVLRVHFCIRIKNLVLKKCMHAENKKLRVIAKHVFTKRCIFKRCSSKQPLAKLVLMRLPAHYSKYYFSSRTNFTVGRVGRFLFSLSSDAGCC